MRKLPSKSFVKFSRIDRRFQLFVIVINNYLQIQQHENVLLQVDPLGIKSSTLVSYLSRNKTTTTKTLLFILLFIYFMKLYIISRYLAREAFIHVLQNIKDIARIYNIYNELVVELKMIHLSGERGWP